MSDRKRLFVTNETTLQALFARQLAMLGGSMDGNLKRDLDYECGFIQNPGIYDYKRYYSYEGVATRAVSVFADECWSVYPELYQTTSTRKTDFERRWEDLLETKSIWTYLHRVDDISGIGHYGLIILGINDGRDLSEPIETINEVTGEPTNVNKQYDLLYMRAVDDTQVTVSKWEMDQNSPRYGHPKTYDIRIVDPYNLNPLNTMNFQVHWSRCIHIADNKKNSELYGEPRLKNIFYYIQNLRKISHSSPEMFYKGAFPGIVFQTIPDPTGLSTPVIDSESLKQEADSYFNGLKRYISLVDMTAQPIMPQVVDPTPHIENQLKLISMTIGVPYRVFVGSEAGHLASTQDSSTWNTRLQRRQRLYVQSDIINPFVHRLMNIGILPRIKKFNISWQDLNTIKETDKADVALKTSQAITAYITGGCDALIPPMEYLTMILGLPVAMAESIEAARQLYIKGKKEGKDFLKMLTEPEPNMKEPALPGTGAKPGVV